MKKENLKKRAAKLADKMISVFLILAGMGVLLAILIYSSGIMEALKVPFNYREEAHEAVGTPLPAIEPGTGTADDYEEAYDRIEQGDWSVAVPFDYMEFLMEDEDINWYRADVNGDSIPELISLNVKNNPNSKIRPIEYIFTYREGKVELVFSDLNDYTEYFFMGNNGRLIYDYTEYGLVGLGAYSEYQFDENWDKIKLETLTIYHFDTNDEEEKEYLKEHYADTYGIYGEGIYYFKDEEAVAREEFLEAYEEMTGLDFVGNNPDWWGRGVRTKEEFYDYEIKTDEDGLSCIAIRGIRDEYAANFEGNYQIVTGHGAKLQIPKTLEGLPVKEISANAFLNVGLGAYSGSLEIPEGISSIGAQAFANCGLRDVTIKESNLKIDSGAFEDNEELWAVYLGDKEAVLGENIFDGCRENVYLCYGVNEEELKDVEAKENSVASYAKEYGNLHAVELPSYTSEEPIVHYYEEPLILRPEVRNFFYGESAAEAEKFCSFEYADDALDFGFPEWHLPCGEFCAVEEWKYEVNASSILASADDKYAAENLAYSDREAAWAEGVKGSGIGESISITQCCGYFDSWLPNGSVYFLDGDIEHDIRDGYLRFTEICVVNGYAKTQKTWEENGRVKRLLMYVENKPYAYLELEDTIKPQYFTLPADTIKVFDGQDIHFKFVIEEVYPGTKYEDTCLTGLIVEFMGRRGH